MEQENVPILRVSTGEAVKSVGDLRENIKLLKKELEGYDEMIEGQLVHVQGLEIGTQEYKDTIDELRINQNALKDAMYGTSASMEQITSAATGASIAFDNNNKLVNEETISYNELVHTMANLKETWRSTTDEVERDTIGERIDSINDRLKELDASVGNNSRNVGDYTNSIRAAFEGAELSSTALGKGIKEVDTASKLFAKNPVMGVLTLVLPIITKIVEKVRESGTATEALNKIMASLQPVMDLTSVVIEKVASAFAWLAEKVSVLLDKLFKKNKDSLPAAVEETNASMESGAESNARYAKSIDKVTESVDDLQAAVNEFTADNILKQLAKVDAEVQKGIEDRRKYSDETAKLMNDIYEAEYNDIGKWLDAQMEQERAAEEEKRRQAELTKEAKIESMYAMADATSSILATIADIYNEEADASARSAKKIKAIRIASATIDTISGAIGALTSAAKNPGGIKGMIIGAANAATITAAGVAQIAKIKSTEIGGTSSPGMAAITSSPSVTTDIPQVRNITSASEEERLNQMAGDQRVVLVMSDLEMKQDQIRVQTEESTF